MNRNELTAEFAPEFLNETAIREETPRDRQEISRLAGSLAGNTVDQPGEPLSDHSPEAGETAVHLPPVPWTERYSANDTGNADHYVDRWGDSMRYISAWNKWMTLDNGWQLDDSGGPLHRGMELSKELLRGAIEIRHEATRTEAVKRALTMGYEGRLKSMVNLASSNPRVVVQVDELDADPMLVAAQNGIIDLRTSEFRPFTAQDLMLKRLGTPFDENAEAPRWRRFLREILNEDEEGTQEDGELVRYIQAAAGYSLTGLTTEQVFFFLQGAGRNGKSTLIENLHKVMGGYGRSTSSEVVAQTKYEPSQHSLADLHGSRFVTLPETEAGQRLAESRLKAIVGGDKITACRKYEHPFDFNPILKLWIHGNHEPRIDGVDLGIWRRVKMIPFNRIIPPECVDRNLGRILHEELPGILNWMIEGCMRWQEEGRLIEPAVIGDATAGYRRDQDILGQFFEEKVTENVEGYISQQNLYEAYRNWVSRQNINYELSKIRFGKEVRKRRITQGEAPRGGVQSWLGISLRPEGLRD